MRLKDVFVAMTFAVSMWAADKPEVGVWKFNPEKSKSAPASSKDSVITIEAVGENAVRSTRTNDGKVGSAVTTYFDGKEVQITNRPGYSRIARQIDERNTEMIFKHDGKEFQWLKATIPPDGKTMTFVRTGTRIDGTTMTEPEINVWDRVK